MSTNRVWRKAWSETRAAKRKARRWKALGIIAEGTTDVDGMPVRTLTILKDGKPVELLSGADVRRALKLSLTRITDWTKAKAIPAAISLDHARCFTRCQVELLRKLAERNDHCANGAQIAERHAVIQEIWARWEE